MLRGGGGDRQLAIEGGAFRRVQDAIGNVHDDLRDEHRSLSDTMRSLRGGGWTGEAADEYAEGWADWETGCGLVLDGLVTMDQTMTAVCHDLDASAICRAMP